MKPFRTYKGEYLVVKIRGEQEPIICRLEEICSSIAVHGTIEDSYQFRVYDSAQNAKTGDSSTNRLLSGNEIESVTLAEPDFRRGNFIKANGVEGRIIEAVPDHVRVDFLPGTTPPVVDGVVAFGDPARRLLFQSFRSKEPIFITEGWLLDFGFKTRRDKGADNFYILDTAGGPIPLLPSGHGGFILTIRADRPIEINFVHQLQNIIFDDLGAFLEYKPK